MRNGAMCILALVLLHSATAWGQSYTDEMYRRALETRGGTAPLYVLISLRDDSTDSERVVCISAPYLFGAIQDEYGLGSDEAGYRRAFDIATSQPGRVFSFSERARSSWPPLYSVEAVAAVREELESMSDQELREQLRDPDSLLSALQNTTLLEFQRTDYALTYREPIAHVLLERGILVGQGDIVSALYLAK